MSNKHHVLIAGTGRAGTSFLVRLLTRCGVDTGYTKGHEGFNHTIRAGCERIAGTPCNAAVWNKFPYVMKSPYLSTGIDALHGVHIPIDAVIVPVRNLDDVYRSRITNKVPWSGDNTREHLAQVLGECIGACLNHNIPLVLLSFNRMFLEKDGAKYLWDHLSPIFSLTDKNQFNSAYQELCDEHENLIRDLPNVQTTEVDSECVEDVQLSGASGELEVPSTDS